MILYNLKVQLLEYRPQDGLEEDPKMASLIIHNMLLNYQPRQDVPWCALWATWCFFFHWHYWLVYRGNMVFQKPSVCKVWGLSSVLCRPNESSQILTLWIALCISSFPFPTSFCIHLLSLRKKVHYLTISILKEQAVNEHHNGLIIRFWTWKKQGEINN